jgi:hypothetical protein
MKQALRMEYSRCEFHVPGLLLTGWSTTVYRTNRPCARGRRRSPPQTGMRGTADEAAAQRVILPMLLLLVRVQGHAVALGIEEEAQVAVFFRNQRLGLEHLAAVGLDAAQLVGQIAGEGGEID